ncbi:MAG: hypothetical protein ABEK84_02370 [Salinibacter sp.]
MIRPLPRLTPSLTLALTGLVIGAFVIAGCDSAGPSASPGAGNVEVQFKTSYASSSSSTSSRSRAAPRSSSPDSLVITGSNGRLTITDIRLIVSGLELEGEADSSEFEAAPSFLDLPLDTNEVAPVAADDIPTGIYTEFEFEVEDVDLEDGDEEADGLTALRDTIQKAYPNWPQSASMVATGTFTPDGDTSRSFTTYFEAEIEVEQKLEPPLEVTDEGLSTSLTVKLDPTQWFSRNDGTVWNLSQFDYGSTGKLVEFDAEFEDGVSEIEAGDDDDD